METFLILAKIAGVLGIVLLNGFFVAAEFAIVRVRSTEIEPLARRENRRARLAQHLITHLDTYLSATQLGITFTSLGLGWLGEPFIARLLLGAFGDAAPQWAKTVSAILGFAIITFLLIVLGELGPRWIAIRNARRTTLLLSGPLHLFYTVFRPFIWLLNISASFLLEMVGITPVKEGEVTHSEEEMRLLLSRGRAFSGLTRSISLNAFELRSRTIREIMVPRTSVVFLSTMKTIEENIATALENQFTRYPLCERDLDNVLGMIHLKDLFRLKGERGSGMRLLEIKREMLFVPETTALDRILNTFLTRRVLMAMAVDEYGGTAGLITLENVLEELVGDINDEFDTEPAAVQKIRDGEYLVDGTMSLHDFARMFDVVPTSHEVVTVGGYAFHLLGRIPERGATLTLGRWVATVDAIDGKKIRTLRIKRLQASDNIPVR
ncbi:MAG TPA: hemolysin family protein [Bacteroidota bacterium]